MRSSRKSSRGRGNRSALPPAFGPLEPRCYFYASSLTQSFFPDDLIGLNGSLLYVDNDDVHGLEIWRTDGTQAGTRMVKDINPGAGDFTQGDFPGSSDFESI